MESVKNFYAENEEEVTSAPFGVNIEETESRIETPASLADYYGENKEQVEQTYLSIPIWMNF